MAEQNPGLLKGGAGGVGSSFMGSRSKSATLATQLETGLQIRAASSSESPAAWASGSPATTSHNPALTARTRSVSSRETSPSRAAAAAAVALSSSAGPGSAKSAAAFQEWDTAITMGILHKFIHLRGWRPRLFVLQGGILRYYKIHGETKVNTCELLKLLREEAEVQIIGTEVSRQEALSIRKSLRSGADPHMPKPQGELHMQVSSLRTSGSDRRKFILHSGVNQVTLRAESRDDRLAWLKAMNSAKGQAARNSSFRLSPTFRPRNNSDSHFYDSFLSQSVFSSFADDTLSSSFKVTLESLSEHLRSGGVTQHLIDEVEQVLSDEHQRMRNLLSAEVDKRRQVVRLLQQLEDEKRKLETTIVVDVNHGMAQRRSSRQQARPEGSLENLPCDFDSAVSGDLYGESELEAEEDEDDGSVASTSEGDLNPASPFLNLEEEQENSSDEDEFFDCELEPAQGSSVRAMRRVSMTEKAGASFLQGEEVPARRTTLPSPAEREKGVSLWSIIRDCIGKDLTRICLPVFFNEPVSALQKSAEDLEYSELLDQASSMPAGSKERLLLVTAFAASGYSSTPGRTRKPFNPLLGETFELVMPEKGFRLVSEKVCHHPTILCSRCQGRGWLYEADGEVKSKFWGRYIELRPVGTMQVTFADGEVYTWHKVVTSINNLIIGKLYIDHGGVMRVVNRSTGMQAKLRFKETSMMDRNPRQLRGHLEDAKGGKMPGTICGKWDEHISFHHPGSEEEVLWRVNAHGQGPSNRYNMTAFSIMMNEIIDSLYAPTDCRLRPDQRALEDGRYKDADREKLRLEHKQREARKAAEEGKPLDPRWFEKVEGATLGESLAYRYKGGYFECKSKGEFNGCRDIFGE